jgi:hypothetical protein
VKIGDLLLIKNPCWLRDDPIGGGSIEKYHQGTMVTLLQEDDPELYHHKVLTPDGKTGWIFKDNLELIQ